MLLGKSHTSGKNSTTRFNLLLLEDGEFFLDDFSVYRFLDSTPSTSGRKIQGRLKVCTRGFFFEPQDMSLPILRFFFREMTRIPMAEMFDPHSGTLYLTFEIRYVVEMKERGHDHPYIQNVTQEKYIFSLLHSKLEDFLTLIGPIYELAQSKKVLNKVDEEQLLTPKVLAPRLTNAFDTSLLVDFRERPLLPSKGKLVDRIVPLLKYPGCLMLTNQRVYFQPAQVNNVGDPVLNWAYNEIKYLYKRRHMLKQTGLEICMNRSSNESVFLTFQSRKDRDEIYDMMVNQPDLKRCQQTDLESMFTKWQKREVSNFEYLLYLNNAAGRTQNDLTQYPVFPWILQDYTSSQLDFTNPQTFRDLSKPMGAINQERLEFFKMRYDAMPRGMEAEGLPPPFLYGTHYSTPGYVLYYLVRMAPEYMLCLQNGKFDAPDRLFKSIPQTWSSCLSNHADLKELIPAFFDTNIPADEWLKNTKNLDLGTTQKLERVANVELPPWATNPQDFVRQQRQALESDHVSEHLHEWIDLIFGYKQQGKEAIKANNLFYYLSYEGSVDLETITDPVEKCSFEAQIQEFGQTPKLLFKSPHPARNEVDKSIEIATAELLPSPRLLKSMSFSEPTNKTSLSNVEEERQAQSEEVSSSSSSSSNSSSSTSTSGKKSVFGFGRRSLGVPSQASKLVGGLSALRKKITGQDSSSSIGGWGWNFAENDWTGSSPHMLHSGEITSLVISKDSRALFSTSKDTTFKICATSDGSLRRNIACNLALTCCAVSSDERFVFIGSFDNCIYMYSVECGRIIDQITAHDDSLSCLCVVDNDRLISSSGDASIKIWKFTSSGISSSPICTFMECDECVVVLDVSTNGNFLAAGTRNGGLVYLYDLKSYELICSTNTGSELVGVRFASDSQSLVCFSMLNELFQVDLEGKVLLKCKVLLSNHEESCAVDTENTGFVRCFTSDGEYAIGGTSKGQIFIWKIDEEAMLSTLAATAIYSIPQAHKNAISSLVISSNGHQLISGASDGSIRLWKLKKKEQPSSSHSHNSSKITSHSSSSSTTKGRLGNFINSR